MNDDGLEKRQLPERSRGFGLLELLIAMSILAIGTLGVMKLQMQSSFGNISSRNQSAAANLARSKMEELKRVISYAVQNLNDPLISNEAVPDLQDQNGSTDLADWSNPDYTEGPFNESQDPSDPRGRIFTRSWNIADDTPSAQYSEPVRNGQDFLELVRDKDD